MSIFESYVGHIVAVMPSLLQGALITIEVTSLSVFFGTIIGIFVALGKMSSRKALRWPSMTYIDVIRGTPLLVQILLFYYGIPGLISGLTGQPLRVDPILAGVFVCSINSGAYVAEIVRAGIQSVDRGQMEAARSLGMTHSQSMKKIILPQAFKNILPPMGNEFIVLLKDSSLLAIIGVPELLQSGRLYIATTFASFPVYIGVALVYLVLTLSISKLIDYLERRLGVSDSRN